MLANIHIELEIGCAHLLLIVVVDVQLSSRLVEAYRPTIASLSPRSLLHVSESSYDDATSVSDASLDFDGYKLDRYWLFTQMFCYSIRWFSVAIRLSSDAI